MVTSGRRDKGASPRGAAMTSSHRRRATLHEVSAATGNRAARGTE
jgi:hypothetical protein